MNVWLVDAICGLLVVLGIALVLKRPTQTRGSLARTVPHANEQPQTYILRIAGVMLAAFGLALGLMVTIVHLT
jgi:hypothetical protein